MEDEYSSSVLAANISFAEMGVRSFKLFCFSTFGKDFDDVNLLCVLDNCSSVTIFSDEKFFIVGKFSATKVNIRNSSGIHVIEKKGMSKCFGEALFDKTIFINILCYYYIMKHPELFEVTRVMNDRGVEIGWDVRLLCV